MACCNPSTVDKSIGPNSDSSARLALTPNASNEATHFDQSRSANAATQNSGASPIGFSVASVEMSSKFSILNFSTDQTTLQRASDALDGYNLVGGLWSIGVCMLMYGQYGELGLKCAIACNLAVIAWINLSYFHAFKKAAAANKLMYPSTVWGLF